ncbi:MAG TPA: ABC transporter ATP-binding protein [Polyangia bacterium]|nr:ABC transporter ATP-binding protein [Polyangia bacterium]
MWSFAAAERRSIAWIAALTVCGGALNAVDPLIVRAIVDHLVARDPVRLLAVGAVGLLLILLVRDGLAALANWVTWRVRLRVHAAVLEATVSRLHALSVSFHDHEPGGARLTRLDRAISGFVGAFSELVFNAFPALVFLGLATVLMARLEWRLLLVIALVVPLPALAGARAAPVQAERERRLLDRWARLYGRFTEVLDGIVTVKSFAMERAEKQRFTEGVNAANALVATGVGFDARVTFVQNALLASARVVVVAYGGVLALRGQISVGTLLAFAGYLGGLFGPVQGLTGIYQTLCRASASLDIIFSILDSREEVFDAPDAVVLHDVGGAVSFEDVHFGYTEGRPVLAGISFEVAPGETVALVGPSGGGKTTLTALLQRLYDPQRGRIRVDGVDLREVDAVSLRRRIGIVPQEPLLFDESVRANIAYGRPEATQAEIEEAARAANAHDFITRLPHGYDTAVGARGARLSAGQRQRVAIARALLKRPSIVVLDEATSALDAESEALVQDALDHLLAGRTTFVIAHRLATALGADRILVLRGGQIVESGTHAALLAARGVYAELFKLQARGLNLDIAA